MRIFAIPTLTSALTAALSVLFFTGLSHTFGDVMLGRLILLQASAAVLVIFVTPQTTAYMAGSTRRAQLVARYRHAFTVEMAGILLGATLLALSMAIPLGAARADKAAVLVFYVSLAVQSLGSVLGWLRVTETWLGYVLWNVGPNLVRVPLVWAAPMLMRHDLLPEISGGPIPIILFFFVLPDMIRLATIALPIAWRSYRVPRRAAVVAAVPLIGRNWIYDIGSQITDSADKIVVGAILGPELLTVYFFARRVGAIISMATEPFYLEHFRRVVALPSDRRQAAARRTYTFGLLVALGIFVLLGGAITLARFVPPLLAIMPGAIRSTFLLFLAIMASECVTAANRWSRFASQLRAKSTLLFAVRLSAFALFALNIWLFGQDAGGLGVVGALAISNLIEAAFVRLGLLRGPRIESHRGHENHAA